MKALSGHTGQTYESWEALVKAESNGYAVAVLIDGWVNMIGPFPSKREAHNKAASLRRKIRRLDDTYTRSVHVQPLWKAESR